MKAYLLTYSYSLVCPPKWVYKVLNTTQAIRNWVSPFPYAAILVSDLTTEELSDILRNRLDDEVWFMVAQLDSELVDGWLPGDFWAFVNDPAEASLQPLLDRLAEKRRKEGNKRRQLRDYLSKAT